MLQLCAERLLSEATSCEYAVLLQKLQKTGCEDQLSLPLHAEARVPKS